jgi:hypothetical protein
VQVCGQALQVKVIPAIRPFQRKNLMRQGSAGNQQHAACAALLPSGFGERCVIRWR